MRGRALVVVAVVAGLLAPAAGAAVERQVKAVNGNHFDPHRIVALTDDSVKWTNTSLVTHNLVEDGSLFTYTLGPGATFSYPFAAPGVYQYRCTIHPFMKGTVVVSNLYMTGPGLVVTHGKLATFSGYAPEGSTVDLNLGANLVKSATANATTGKFSMSVPAVPGWYQAKVGTTTSSPILLKVKPRLNVKSRKKNKSYWITVSTSPDQTGGKVVLERKQGSAWKKVSTHTLGGGSKTVFKVTPKVDMKVRLRLSVPKNGYSKTTSGTLTLHE